MNRQEYGPKKGSNVLFWVIVLFLGVFLLAPFASGLGFSLGGGHAQIMSPFAKNLEITGDNNVAVMGNDNTTQPPVHREKGNVGTFVFIAGLIAMGITYLVYKGRLASYRRQ